MQPFLRFAYALSGARAGQALTDEDEVAALLQAPDLAWLHMQADSPQTPDWISAHLGYLDAHALSGLVATETRPRAYALDEGAVVFLRGINTNEGADPEDMVSIRLWVDKARIVSLSIRQLGSVGDIEDLIRAGRGPVTAGEFLALLVERLTFRMEGFLTSLDEATDEIEEVMLDGPSASLRHQIGEVRRKVLAFRRYLLPQREALSRLTLGDIPFIDRPAERRLREATDRVVRALEELDSMRERLSVVRDEMTNALSERLNRNLYLLSLISAVFLPLGFLTGLFGVNLAGMPGADWSSAFWMFSGALALIIGLQIGFLWLIGWF